MGRFGPYEILEVIGRGGMATVVRARGHGIRDRPDIVALKFLHRELLEDQVLVDAFRFEGYLGMKLRHPSLARTFAIETWDDRMALVLEYVEGFSLHDVHRHLLDVPYFRRSPEVIALLTAELCRGLHSLHELVDEDGRRLGTVHRDVTPQNVIVNVEGSVKLVDFGIVFSPTNFRRTATGMVKGKLSYLAPEYLMGKIWNHQIDVWSVGVVLWEMLTGRRLFKGSTPSSTVSAVLAASIPSPAVLRPSLPGDLCRIVQRALHRNPRERHATTAALADELEAFVRASSPGTGSLDVLDWLAHFPLGPRSSVVRVGTRGADDDLDDLDEYDDGERNEPTRIERDGTSR